MDWEPVSTVVQQALPLLNAGLLIYAWLYALREYPKQIVIIDNLVHI